MGGENDLAAPGATAPGLLEGSRSARSQAFQSPPSAPARHLLPGESGFSRGRARRCLSSHTTPKAKSQGLYLARPLLQCQGEDPGFY